MSRYRIKVVWRDSCMRFIIQKKRFFFWKEVGDVYSLKLAQECILQTKDAEAQVQQFNREQEEQCEKL